MVEFYKYHGAGNDFILIDNRSKVFNPDKKIIKNLCRRHLGVGADGLILLEDDSLSGYMMRYFNSDGKEASMCGNGGRCFVAFAQSLGLCNDHFIFNAFDGYHEAIILKRDKDSYLINLKMNDVSTVLPYDEGFYLDTGSPHLVVFTNYINKIDVFKTGKELRLLPKWGADGVNVNFAQIENNKIISRTYERGVENETLACGTGAVAIAISAVDQNLIRNSPVKIEMCGGTLKVHYEKREQKFTNIWLEGPAVMVFKGGINL